MVQFEKRSVSGQRFKDATKATSLNGFSRRGLPVAAQRLKPSHSSPLGGMAEGMP